MRIIISKDYKDMSKKAAHILAGQLIMKPESVIGLATGSTPLGIYEYLVSMYKDDLISFERAVTFNLDEYCGLDGKNPQSYRYFMDKNLFDQIDILKENIHIPNGIAENLEEECLEFEMKIRDSGGIDFQLLGIGRNGHIGFNEPDLKFESSTHVVQLDDDTRDANARFFNNMKDVPEVAISMGIKTIMHSKKILLLASGAEKAGIVYEMIYGDIGPNLPASVLQLHPDVTVIIDEDAAGALIDKRGADSQYIRIE